MLPVSQAFIEAAESRVRSSVMRVTLSFDSNENIEYTPQYTSYLSASTEVFAGQMNNNVHYFYTQKWTRLQTGPKGWALGQSALAPFTNTAMEYGMWSRKISGSDNRFAVDSANDGFLMQFRYETNVPDVHIVFDKAENQYAVDFNLHIASINPEEPERVIEIRSNTRAEWQFGQEIMDVFSLRVIPITWSHPGEPARIAELYFFQPDLVFDGGSLFEVKVIESCEQDGQNTSAGLNRLHIKFNNADRKILISHGVKDLKVLPEFAFEISDGVFEWIPMGVFFASEWNFDKNNKIVTLEAVDNLSLLGDTSIETPYLDTEHITADSFAASVLEPTSRWFGGLQIDEGIKGNWATQIAHILPNDVKSALVEIAVNMGSYLSVDRRGDVSIQPFDIDPEVIAYRITPSNRFQGKSKITPYDTFNAVFILSYAVSRGSETELFRGVIRRDNTDDGSAIYVRVEYTGAPVEVDTLALTGTYPADTEIRLYSDYALFGLKQNGEYELTIRGVPIMYDQRPTSFIDDIRSRKRVDYDLRFIQDTQTLDFVLNILQSRHKNRRARYEIECRGNPALEIGDTVAFESEGGIRNGILIQSEYTYTGGLRTRYILKGEQ